MNTLSGMSRTNEVPLLFTLARVAAAVLIVSLVVAYFIVALGIEEYKAIWTRAHTSHSPKLRDESRPAVPPEAQRTLGRG
jgi:hypothetical protein